jgi:hypothetical protein
MTIKALRRAVFEDLASTEDDASASARSALRDAKIPDWVSGRKAVAILRRSLRSDAQAEALAVFVRELVHSALHSALVTIDGGSASAEVGRVRLVDLRGRSLGDDLHSLYVDYLFDTGRLS